eukprot:5087840-Amphidinium_carterae.1
MVSLHALIVSAFLFRWMLSSGESQRAKRRTKIIWGGNHMGRGINWRKGINLHKHGPITVGYAIPTRDHAHHVIATLNQSIDFDSSSSCNIETICNRIGMI